MAATTAPRPGRGRRTRPAPPSQTAFPPAATSHSPSPTSTAPAARGPSASTRVTRPESLRITQTAGADKGESVGMAHPAASILQRVRSASAPREKRTAAGVTCGSLIGLAVEGRGKSGINPDVTGFPLDREDLERLAAGHVTEQGPDARRPRAPVLHVAAAQIKSAVVEGADDGVVRIDLGKFQRKGHVRAAALAGPQLAPGVNDQHAAPARPHHPAFAVRQLFFRQNLDPSHRLILPWKRVHREPTGF